MKIQENLEIPLEKLAMEMEELTKQLTELNHHLRNKETVDLWMPQLSTSDE